MINVAIVGAGGIARRHVEALGKLANVRIVAVMDIVPERAHSMATAVGATAYSSIDDCLERADVVYVLTPPSTHRALCLRAMEAGKHVMCEKPIASSIPDAEAIVAGAHRYNVKLMIAFNMRFRKAGLMLKQAFDSGKLGRVYNFWIHRMGPSVSGYNWRTDPQLLCGVAIESMSHDIDQIRWIAGEIADVRATVFESRSDLPGYDTDANVALSLANGGMAVLHVSWASPLGHNARGLIGTEGAVMVDGPNMWDWQYFHTKTTDMLHEEISVINDMLATTDSYLEETTHFIECVENNTKPAITGEDGLKALRVSHAILQSGREGVVVKTSTEC